MNNNSKIVFCQCRTDDKVYVVKRLTNRTTPAIGTTIKRDEVDRLLQHNPHLTIEIQAAK